MAMESGLGTTPLFGTVGGYPLCACCGQFHAVQDTAVSTGFFALNADARGDDGPNGKDSRTTDEAAAQITRNNNAWGGVLGQGATVTYAFRSAAPTTLPTDVSDFSRFSLIQINATLDALNAWMDVANIRFQRVDDGDGYSNSATILFSNYGDGQDSAAAFAYQPGSTAATSVAGDVWVNVSLSYNANPVILGYGYQVLTHEIGHAIGLSHPSVYNAAEGVTITYSANASYYEDSRQYSLMSYFSETNTGGNFNSTSGARQYSAAPLLDDIAAAQRLYGANTTTRLGDTVYGFNSNADRAWFVATSANTDLIFAVWDAGGNDTFDFSGFREAQVIDLRQGGFSNVGGLVGNIAVAMGTVIENAIGGSGADRLFGNSGDNLLTGGAGADTIDGGLGVDTAIFSGARSAYTITYGGQVITVSGPDGIDVLTNVEFLQFSDQRIATTPTGGLNVSGDVLANTLTGTAFADVLNGLGGADLLNGLAGADTLDGGSGDDTVNGGDGDDVLIGGAGNDRIDGGAGYDIVDYATAAGGVVIDIGGGRATGGAGTDTLISIEEYRGSTFSDRIVGGAGNDVIRGGGGIDTLEGGAGDDRLYAGAPGQGGGAPDIVKGAATANGSVASALSLDGGFDLLARDGVAEATTVPHATVIATSHGGVEFYAVTVTAGARIFIDIDNANFDSTLRILDAGGTELARNDDAATDGGNATDSAISHTFATAGVYYIEVAEWRSNTGSVFNSGSISANGTYTLHVSVTGHAVAATTLYGSTLIGDAGNDSLYGGAGADVLNGGAGDDYIDGGAGDDIAVFSGSASDYVFTQTAQGWTVRGATGTDTLVNVEFVQFSSGGPVAIRGSQGVQFDALTYIASNPDLIRALGADAAAGAAHYQAFQSEGRPINSFDALTYIASNPDLIRAFGTDTATATLHYIRYGYFEGRSADSFNPLQYVASNLDLARAFGTNEDAAARHFIVYGLAEGRSTTAFNPQAYLASNADLARSIGNDVNAGLHHYLEIGLAEGRPTNTFEPLSYVASYADLIRAFGTNGNAALQHYLTSGADEGRSVTFDARLYAATHLDLARAIGGDRTAAALHYIQSGFAQGRAASGFDAVAYLLSNGDLAGMTPSQALDHWLQFGADEGRIGDVAFGREQTSHSLTGSITQGAVTGSGDRDWFQISLTAGQRVTLDLVGTGGGGGTLANSALQVFDATGRLLASDADSGPDLDARLVFTAATTGIVYIVASGEMGRVGTYQLVVSSAAPDGLEVASAAETDAAADWAALAVVLSSLPAGLQEMADLVIDEAVRIEGPWTVGNELPTGDWTALP